MTIAKLSEENEAHTAMTLKEPCVLKGLKKELGQKYEESEIEDALSDVIELTEAGRLFVEDAYECMIEEVKKRKTVVKALCFILPMTAIWPANTASRKKGSTMAGARL